jgi:hypothetical protein
MIKFDKDRPQRAEKQGKNLLRGLVKVERHPRGDHSQDFVGRDG